MSSKFEQKIMGILNVTPDSFSDGGQHESVDEALKHALCLTVAGAGVIDVGGQSTRPGAQELGASEELARVLPLIEKLHSDLHAGGIDERTRISIDTFHVQVAAAACGAGASIINDITGFQNPEMIEVAASTGADCIVMHMQGSPQTMQDDPFYIDIVEEVGDFLLAQAAKLEDAGISKESIILDPGFGFGKAKEHNLELLLFFETLSKRIHDSGYRLLAGLSRKSLIASLFGIENPCERDEVSAQLAAALVLAGADIVRVHNVELTRAALEMSLDSGDVQSERNPKRSSAFIALGSNLGWPIKNLGRALAWIDKLPGTRLVNFAAPVLSEPAYDSEQEAFTNTVCEVETSLGAATLFAYLQAIEVEMGRVKARENGPRVIDLDLLNFDKEVIDLPGLVLPHPRMAERAFVLEPLKEIAPDFCLPCGAKLEAASEVYGAITTQIPKVVLEQELTSQGGRL